MRQRNYRGRIEFPETANMNSRHKIKLAICLLIPVIAVYLAIHRSYYFNNITYLVGAMVLELLLAVVWDFRRKYFWLTIIAFLGAGMSSSLQDDCSTARWLVLGVGAIAGCAIYMKDPRYRLNILHWVAMCCVLSAIVSATVSSFPQVAALKAASLLLLFLYGMTGVKLAIMDREEEFFDRLLVGCEILVYSSAVAYFILHWDLWGNPNSLGVVMSVFALPLLLWGMIVSPTRNIRRRRIFALIFAVLLLLRSYERAGIAAAIVSSLFLCIPLRQYRLLVKGALLALLCALIVAAFVPVTSEIVTSDNSLISKFVYKDKQEKGFLGSRKSVWDETVSTLRQHPWFGTGFGTTNSLDSIKTSMTYTDTNVTREHGNSYLAVAEWTGLLGVAPFFVLLGFVVRNLFRVSALMRKTASPYSFAIPLAAVVVAGLVNAAFEDWLFAVGYHACVFFWILALAMPDFLPTLQQIPADEQYQTYATTSQLWEDRFTGSELVIARSHAPIY